MTEVLVVGAGFTGLYAALGLKRVAAARHRVTVVSQESFFQYQPFLPEVASGTIDPRAAVVPLRPILRHCRLVIGEATRIDHAERRAHVRLADGGERAIGYDVLVLAPGSRSRVLPVPGLAERGIGFKTVQEAIFLRNHVLAQLEVASVADDEAKRRAALTFVFVGAGFAGVEALGELEDLSRDAISSYPELTGTPMRWVLVEATGRILPELTEELARYAKERLEDRGIEIALETRLDSAERGLISLSNGESFPAETLVWTA
ncbi:MAG TPA: FAD-dependent oxidoreductase, partial [Actinomycetota bacterium]|nr:FAD-dependent oxidoreductase [Actinomycetota bacterium]